MEKKKFWSIYGQDLVVQIDKTAICLRVLVSSSYKSLYIKCIVLFLLVIIDLVFLIQNITSFYMTVGFFFLLILLLHIICWTVIEETLTIMRGLGVQIETKYVVGSKSVFVPTDQLQTVFINEVIVRNRVLFMLTFSITNENAKEILIPLFVESFPQLSLLELIFHYIRNDILKT